MLNIIVIIIVLLEIIILKGNKVFVDVYIYIYVVKDVYIDIVYG